MTQQQQQQFLDACESGSDLIIDPEWSDFEREFVQRLQDLNRSLHQMIDQLNEIPTKVVQAMEADKPSTERSGIPS